MGESDDGESQAAADQHHDGLQDQHLVLEGVEGRHVLPQNEQEEKAQNQKLVEKHASVVEYRLVGTVHQLGN